MIVTKNVNIFFERRALKRAGVSILFKRWGRLWGQWGRLLDIPKHFFGRDGVNARNSSFYRFGTLLKLLLGPNWDRIHSKGISVRFEHF